MVKSYQRSKRGTGLKFSVEAFSKVRSFTPYTPIRYGPNPKRPGSKSFDRYNGYKKASTVGEALKLGTKVADLLWELQRGDYKVLATPKKPIELRGMTANDVEAAIKKLETIIGPRGLAINLADANAAAELRREEEWQLGKIKLAQQWAKKLGVELETETIQDLHEGGVYESADIRNGRRVADALAQEKLKARRKLTEKDVTEVLQVWGFAQNVGRLNVLPDGRKWVYSDTLGAIKHRVGTFGVTPPTRRYPAVAKLLNQWLLDNRPAGLNTDFMCTSINMNANYAARTHRDGNNVGPSAIRAFGGFTGGELLYWDTDSKTLKPEDLPKREAQKLNIKRQTEIFDGNRAHAVAKFKGERMSIVFFSCRNFNRVGQTNITFLKRKCGFQWPSDKSLAVLKKHASRKR